MPEARALKTFQSRYGLQRAGALFHCPPDYFRQLKKNGLVVEHTGPAPDRNRSIPEAPNRGGKGDPARAPTPDTGAPPASGKGATSSSAQAGQVSTTTTSNASGGGAVTSQSIQRRPAAKKKKKTTGA